MAGELILIVEDNDKNRKLERDVLHAKGYRTIETCLGNCTDLQVICPTPGRPPRGHHRSLCHF